MAPRRLSNSGEPPASDRTGAEYRIVAHPLRVCDMPEGLRPREEMTRLGVEHVSDVTLLAVLLRTGVRGVNVQDLARQLLCRYGSFSGMAGASVAELAGEPGMGPVKAQIVMAAVEIARRLARETAGPGSRVRQPADAAALIRPLAQSRDHEVFWVLMLDAKNQVKGDPHEVTRGLLDASLVHPREVFREAIRTATAAVVVAHNHPSGDPSPSAEDLRITKQLVEAGRIVDIKVLDHVIMGRRVEGESSDFVSMREAGLVNFG